MTGVAVRPVQPDDAEAFLTLCKTLDAETAFMMLEPGERTTTLAEQRSEIEALGENEAIFLAEEDETLVGFLSCHVYPYRRKRHCAYIVIGVLRAHTGRGVGKRCSNGRKGGRVSAVSPA